MHPYSIMPPVAEDQRGKLQLGWRTKNSALKFMQEAFATYPRSCTNFFRRKCFCNKAKTLHANICRNFLQQQQPQSKFKNNLNHKFTKQTIELPDDTSEP